MFLTSGAQPQKFGFSWSGVGGAWARCLFVCLSPGNHSNDLKVETHRFKWKAHNRGPQSGVPGPAASVSPGIGPASRFLGLTSHWLSQRPQAWGPVACVLTSLLGVLRPAWVWEALAVEGCSQEPLESGSGSRPSCRPALRWVCWERGCKSLNFSHLLSPSLHLYTEQVGLEEIRGYLWCSNLLSVHTESNKGFKMSF